MAHAHIESSAAVHSSKLQRALWLTAAYLLLEVIAGFWTGSLALLADAGHMLTDVGALFLALFAIRIARRPATSERSYGFYRVEILAALANAVVLVVISLFVLLEAYERFRNPSSIAGVPMLLVAIVGLGVNAWGVLTLRSASKDSLNLKGAYFEVLSDAVSSVGVVAAAATIWLTGWTYVDPVVSAGIGLFILPRTWRLLSGVVNVLLEGTPADVDVPDLRTALEAIEGVADVHDLHVWALTSGVNALSVHVVNRDGQDAGDLLRRVDACATGQFRIAHVTVQIEPPSWPCKEQHL